MKFGRNYYKHQLAQWADAYMNYDALKRLCAESTASANLEGKMLTFPISIGKHYNLTFFDS